MTYSTLCTARNCFMDHDCERLAENNEPLDGQLYRDYSRDMVVKNVVRQACPYFVQVDHNPLVCALA